MRNWPLTGVMLALMALGGCGTVVRSVPPGADAMGLVYALPKGQVEVVFSRHFVEGEEVETARKTLADAQAAESASKAKLKERESSKLQASALSEAAARAAKGKDATSPAQALARRLERDELLAKLMLDLAVTDVKRREAAVAEALSAFRLVEGQVGNWVEKAEISVLPNIADTDHRFVLKHVESASRDDMLRFDVSNGLLSSSNAESTGQAATILLNLARTFGAGQAGPSRNQVANKLARVQPETPSGRKRSALRIRFDPTNQADFDTNNRLLHAEGWELKLSSSTTRQSAPLKPLEAPQIGAPLAPFDGLMYRAEVPVTVTVQPQVERPPNLESCKAGEGPVGLIPAQVSGIFPDSTTRFALPMQGAAFAKVSSKYTFKNGVPVSAEIDRPSQLVAITALPVDILKALISVPAELIKLRVDYSSQAAAQAEAQVREAKAQQELLKALEDLEAARSTKAP